MRVTQRAILAYYFDLLKGFKRFAKHYTLNCALPGRLRRQYLQIEFIDLAVYEAD
jgi:hypothetical protein